MTLKVEEKFISGAADEDWLKVRHLVLKGSQEEIGRHLGKIGRDRYKVMPAPSADPFSTRVQREYLQQHWPQHYARMVGAARAYDIDLSEDEFDLSGLAYSPGAPIPGCSCVFYPGASTSSGHSTLSRNFDWSLNVERSSTKEPYLCEVYPDQGYPHLLMSAYDLIGGATDGVNSEGLTVALLSELETTLPAVEPSISHTGPNFENVLNPLTGETLPHAIGVSEIQVVRFLLETCKDVDEAKAALLTVRTYHRVGALHYIIGDSSGRGFVYEGSQQGIMPRFFETDTEPLAVTNHALYKETLMDNMIVKESVKRLERLRQRIGDLPGSADIEFMRESCRSVAAVYPALSGQYSFMGDEPSRTLWEALYDSNDRALEINFYRHDKGAREKPKIIRSPNMRFVLES